MPEHGMPPTAPNSGAQGGSNEMPRTLQGRSDGWTPIEALAGHKSAMHRCSGEAPSSNPIPIAGDGLNGDEKDLEIRLSCGQRMPIPMSFL